MNSDLDSDPDLDLRQNMANTTVTDNKNVAAYLNKGNIKVTVVGKPNCGKSTLINNICDSDLITSPLAHTTRDPTK